MRKLLLSTLLVSSLGLAVADSKGVVMDFGALDTIDALGGSEMVVALPKNNAPDYLVQYTADQYQSSGGMKDPDIELIRKVQPDFIITSARQGQFIEELQTIAPVTAFMSSEETTGQEDYLVSVKNNILNVAKVIDKEPEANTAWEKLETKIKSAAEKSTASVKKAVVVLHNDGKMGIANNSNYAKVVHDVVGIKRADEKTYEGRNPADTQYFVDTNPDIIFVVDRSAAIGATPMDQNYFSAPEFANVQAVKDGKVIMLSPKLWYLSGNGLQSLDLQVDEVSKALD